ncbi:hypothetical protein BKA57DRAFT_462525 [Linnemannia elongata]|nr:hypothetical protein BKA57DRAFT_462525 [Linnemannia elongata]
MAPPHRDYCCCCIPLRFGVFIISLIALALGALNLWSVLRVADADQTSKIAGYVATGVYGLVGLSGMLSVLCKVYPLAKNFSVLWWTTTIIVTILNVITVVVLATSQKENARDVCRTSIINDNTLYNPSTLEDDVNTCYRLALIVAGVVLAVEAIVMSLCGWVASRYTSEVKHMHDHEYNTQAQIQMAYPKV